ncbi:MAG TPA: PDZ domain-containing protein, partial [Coxiellaceae bacterium]|nr:PDZ domain-containing protein [Coxiellaceae bacterium]
NPGNSGGALVNMQGQLIGINTAMMAPSMASAGIGFAIPSNMAKSVVEQLLKYGKVERGVLGVVVQNITPELKAALHLSTTKGAMVSQILSNTPAATAGLHVEDIITAVNEDAVHGAEQLRNTMGLIHPGVSVTLTVLRNHQIKKLTAIVANPKSLKQPVLPYLSGMRLQKINLLEKDGSHLRGLLITGLSDTSAGALAGLASGDVITAVNEKPVATLQALQQMIAHQTKPVLLNVVREHNNLFVVLNKT